MAVLGQQALLAQAIRNADTRLTIVGRRMSHSVVYQTKRTDLLKLAELGPLAVRKTGRSMVFRAVDVMEGKLAKLGRNAPERPHRSGV